MKRRILCILFTLIAVQNIMAQLTSLGLVEESNIASEWNTIRDGALGFVPKLAYNGDYLYAATPNGLHRSHCDSLGAWEKIPFTDELVIDFDVHGDTLVALSRNELFISLDNGKTIKAISKTEFMGEEYSLQGIAVSPADAKEIIVTNGYRLAVTHDGGEQWSMEQDVHLTKLYYNPLVTNSFIGFNNSTTTNECYYYYSTDGYNQWSESEHIYEGLGNIAELYDITFHPTQEGRVIAYGQGRYCISDNSGASWTHICDSRHPHQPIVNVTDVEYDKRNPDILYAADMTAKYANQLTILRSTDGGHTWNSFYSIAKGKGHALSIALQDNLLAIYTYGKGIYLLDVDALDKQISKPHLVTEGKQWAVCVTGTLLPPNQTTCTYRLQGDTIINSKRYLIEHESYDMHLNGWIPSGHYMREEDGKVYRKYGRKKETILLDYNMQVGDTLRYNDRTDGMGNIIDDYYTYVCLVGVRDTILPNGDGVLRRCYDAVIGEYAQGEYHSTNWEATFVEDIGWLDTGLSDEIFITEGCGKKLLYIKQDDKLLYQKEKGVYWKGDHVNWRPLTRRGNGIYHSDSYLYAYTIDEAAGVTDSTDFTHWNDHTVIRFDVDTIGYNAFSGATFRQGQIICFSERLNTILKDAFAGINIVPRSSQETAITDDLTLVFEGANPPSIDKSHVMDYADSSYRINYVVPDLTTYIASDIQWTYTSLMTFDDLLGGNISPENKITVTDPTEVKATDVEEDSTENNSGPTVEVEARPRKDIPVRIGDGENKDIYSRAPAWQRYTIELKITDSSEAVLYEESMTCTANSACVFNATLPYWPNDDIIYLHSRSIDMFGRATEWTTQTVTLTRIEHAKVPDCDAYYDLMGRKIANPVHGIYIKNGKKVIL